MEESLKDEQLLLISNLLHIVKEKDFPAGFFDLKNASEENTIGKMLEKLLKGGTLEKLRADTSGELYNGEISPQEWAAMLEQIQSDEQLCGMTLRAYEKDDKNGISVCLTDSEGNAYVAFRGTGGGEWYDNFVGAYMTDTEQQRRALSFINNLEYNNITVVGHSKGGNKAKYVSLLSDKVTRCISFDGQGFSRQFQEKYGILIEENRWKITNYALDGDFVNILLYDIGGGEKTYVAGHGVGSFPENHSPNSFYNDVFGFDKASQNKEMETLHGFVLYVLNTISKEDSEILFPFLGTAAQYSLGRKPPDYTEKYDEDMADYILDDDNAEAVGILLAYLVKYEEKDDAIVGAVCGILENTGQKNTADILKQLDKYVGLENMVKAGAQGAMGFDKIASLLGKEGGSGLGLIAEAASARYEKLPGVKANEGEYRAQSTRRDFTEDMKRYLLGLCDEIGGEPWYNLWVWGRWEHMEKHTGPLDQAISNINRCYGRMDEMNKGHREAISRIFANVEELDSQYGRRLHSRTERLRELREELGKLEIPV